MSRRVLLVVPPEADPAQALAHVGSLLPRTAALLLVAVHRDDAPALQAALDAWPAGPGRTLQLAPGRLSDLLDELAGSRAPDLLAVAPGPDAAPLSDALAFADRTQLPVVVLPAADPRPATHVLALTDGRLTGAPQAAAFVRDALPGVGDVGVLVVGESRAATAHVPLETLSRLAGLEVHVEESWVDGVSEAQAFVLARRDEGRASVVVVPAAIGRAIPSRIVAWGLQQAVQRVDLPVVVLPAPPLFTHARLHATDALVVDGRAFAALELERWVERVRPAPGTLATLGDETGGSVEALVDHAGTISPVLPADLGGTCSVSVSGADPTALRLVRPSGAPLAFFDVALLAAEVPGDFVRRVARDASRTWCALRMRPDMPVDRARQWLSDRGLPSVPLLDAGVLLDDGGADDVPALLDGVRLVRVAVACRLKGLPVATVVTPGEVAPVDGVEVRAPVDLPDAAALPPVPRSSGLVETLDRWTGTRAVPGNRVSFLLDNREARRELLARIDGAAREVLVQTYIATDDDAGRRIEDALRRAVARGVRVCVLADALYSLHEALGRTNPLLARLGAIEGLQLRAVEPVVGLPTVDGLKRRAHRKLVVVDGTWATVSGRNLAHEYYIGFDEVPLVPDTDWRLVPWLDASVSVQGPLVDAVREAFDAEWRVAGGDPRPAGFPSNPQAGDVAARLLLHDGGREARILDALLALLGEARERVTVVNAFPLALEVQHALLQALRRGVKVRVLSGRVRPRYAGRDEQAASTFAGGAFRDLGDQLVLARLDPLVAAGADVRVFRLRAVPGWDPSLGDVFPYVHAKVVVVDGASALVGSANLDVTASYWEGEASVLVEDAASVRPFESALHAMLDGSIPLSRLEPAETPRQRFRAWLAEHWPRMLG